MKNYYQILGIEETANADVVKKAFHRLAKLYHPDKNANSKLAAEKFIEVNEAYEVLSNSTKKSQYDALRKAKNQTFNYQYKGRNSTYNYNSTQQHKKNNFDQRPPKTKIPSRWNTIVLPIAFFIFTGLIVSWAINYKSGEKTETVGVGTDETIKATWATGAIPNLGIKDFEFSTKYKKEMLAYECSAEILDGNNTISNAILKKADAKIYVDFLDVNKNSLFFITLILVEGKLLYDNKRQLIAIHFYDLMPINDSTYNELESIRVSYNF